MRTFKLVASFQEGRECFDFCFIKSGPIFDTFMRLICISTQEIV